MPRMNDENTHPAEMYSAYDAERGSIEKENLDELRKVAEGMASCLNAPLAYRFDEEHNFSQLTLTFLMPRKMATFELTTQDYDRDEAQTWLDDFTRRYWTRWFGWNDTDSDTKQCWVCRTSGHLDRLVTDGERWICVACNDE